MYNTIGMPEFYQEAKRKKLPIIDVREEMEYQLGHVPQAINLPLSTLTENYQQLDKNQPYYLICQMGSRLRTSVCVSQSTRVSSNQCSRWYIWLVGSIRTIK